MATDVLTHDEVHGMLRCVGSGRTAVRNRALLVLMWRSGLRLDEACSLLTSDVNATDGTVHVRCGKGNKPRTVGVDPLALAVVRDYAEARRDYATRRGSPLFCTLVGGKLKPQYVQQLVARLAARAGLDKHVHPHMLRHTYACDLMRDGFDVKKIMTLMGHSNLRATEEYLRKVGSPQELTAQVHARPSWAAAEPDEGDRARAQVMRRSAVSR